MNPTPFLDATPLTYAKRQANWDKLAELLKTLSVQKVIISGMYLWQHEDPERRGCVGFTIHQLQKRSITTFQSKVVSNSYYGD